MSKYYSAHGRAGCVEIRKNRITKTEVGLYHSEQSGMEADPELPWTTVCEEHHTLVSHRRLKSARFFMAYPEWCETCQPKVHAYVDRFSDEVLDARKQTA